MQVSTAEFRKGLRIVFDGHPYTIVEFQHVKPGKGGAFVVARNFGNVPQTPGPSQVDHICYTIPNWNDQRLMASLTAAGTKPTNRNPGGNSINVFDPNNYQVQLASIVGENAWRK